MEPLPEASPAAGSTAEGRRSTRPAYKLIRMDIEQTRLNLNATACSVFDWNELAALWIACFPAADPRMIAFLLANNRHGTRVLRANGRIAGFSLNNTTHGADFAWLEVLVVSPEFHGRGLGRAVLADYESFVSRLGYPCIRFAVDRDNASAIALYERCGYSLQPNAGQRLNYAKQLGSAVRSTASPSRPGRMRRAFNWLQYRLLVRRRG